MLKSPIFLVGDFFCLSLYGNQITNIMKTTNTAHFEEAIDFNNKLNEIINKYK